ncbi:MAG: response regulator [Nitrospirota bacterium]|nr:response regulator [Nitrospirota bacterium]
MKKRKPRNLDVVVAEKNSEDRATLCSLIASLNCVAIPTCSGLETLMVIKEGSVALVLLDVDLLFSKRESALQEIRQIAPMLPVIMMSGVLTPALSRRLGERGAQGFLVKPIQRDQLAMTLFRYLL